MQPKERTKKYKGQSILSGVGSVESRMANRRRRISSFGGDRFSARRRRPFRLRKAPRYPQQSSDDDDTVVVSSETGILPATSVEWNMNKDLEIPFSSLMGSTPAQGILDKFLPESSKNWAINGLLMTAGQEGL